MANEIRTSCKSFVAVRVSASKHLRCWTSSTSVPRCVIEEFLVLVGVVFIISPLLPILIHSPQLQSLRVPHYTFYTFSCKSITDVTLLIEVSKSGAPQSYFRRFRSCTIACSFLPPADPDFYTKVRELNLSTTISEGFPSPAHIRLKNEHSQDTRTLLHSLPSTPPPTGQTP